MSSLMTITCTSEEPLLWLSISEAGDFVEESLEEVLVKLV